MESIRNLAAVKPLNDAETEALGVRVLDKFCADLVPPSAEPDEDELQVDDAAHVQPEHGYEDRATGDNIPKRKWKRKVYPASAVRRSARIRKAKKFHDDL